MTQELSFSNFFSSFYIFHPYGEKALEELSTNDRAKALACSIILGLFTAGLVHLGCWIAERCIKPVDGETRINEIAKRSIISEKEPNSLQKLQKPEENQTPPIIDTPTPKPPEPKKLHPADDPRQEKWLDQAYFSEHFNNLKLPNVSYLSWGDFNADTFANRCKTFLNIPAYKHKKAFCCPIRVSENHWTLIYICHEKRVVEYYDSKVNYIKESIMIPDLLKVARACNEGKPGDTNYQISLKIKKKLQPNSYQCAPWLMYFMEMRGRNPDVDFNELDVDEAQQMIAAYRIQVVDSIPEERLA